MVTGFTPRKFIIDAYETKLGSGIITSSPGFTAQATA